MNTRGQEFGGPWTEHKLECVKKYLSAYTTIMAKQRFFRFAYIDAFAGTGYRELKHDEDTDAAMFPEFNSPEVVDFQQGSARNALEVEPPFEKYVFIEKSANRYVELEELKKEFLLKAEFSENSIECVQGDANPYLQNLCGKNWRSHRALVFLDPYGMQMEWETIRAIAGTEAIDLWILFPIGSVNRLLKNDGEIHAPNRDRLDLFFGETDWFDVFYQLAEQISFFSPEEQIAFFNREEHWQKTGHIFEEIERYFIERLRSVFAGVAPQPLWLRNSKNVPLYLLCFAAGNPKGAPTAVKIAQHNILTGMRTGSQLTF